MLVLQQLQEKRCTQSYRCIRYVSVCIPSCNGDYLLISPRQPVKHLILPFPTAKGSFTSAARSIRIRHAFRPQPRDSCMQRSTSKYQNNLGAYICMNGQKLEEVTSFKYLGAILYKDGTCSAEVRNKIASTEAVIARQNRIRRCNTALQRSSSSTSLL